MRNVPVEHVVLLQRLREAGYAEIPGLTSLKYDADYSNRVVAWGYLSKPIVKRGSGQQAYIVSIATGCLSVYSVTDGSDTRQVMVPQVMDNVPSVFPAAVLEQVLLGCGM